MILQPGEVPLRHVSTPARMAEVLRTFCELDIPDALLKVLHAHQHTCSAVSKLAVVHAEAASTVVSLHV